MAAVLILSERFIRKTWFIILRHLKEHPLVYHEACKELGISNIKEILTSGIEILETSEFELAFHDDIERDWHQNNNVKINFVAKILHKYEAKICAIINNKILAGRIKRTAHNNKKLSKGGIAQTIFNISATDWDLETKSNQITFNKNSEKTVNAEKILVLYKYVKSISVYFPKEVEELSDEVSFLQKELEKELIFKNKSHEFNGSNVGLQNHNKVWSKISSFPKSLLNTKWLRYERRDSFNIDPDSIISTRGFSIGSIEFIEGKKKFPVRETCVNLDSNNIKITNILEGICRFESDTGYLFIEMNKINTNQKVTNIVDMTSLYVLHINKIDVQNQEIIIGYHIFFSLIKHKYLVKTTLFVKFRDNQNLPFIPNIISTSDSEYENIAILIRRFFAERSLNRLTIPSSAISHLEKVVDNSGTLHEFLSRQGKIFDDVILSGFTGSFKLFYYYKKNHPTHDDIKYLNGIRQDKLVIEYDNDVCELRAVFIHKDKEIYKGKGFRKNRTVQFLLEQTNSLNNSVKKLFNNGDNDRKVVYFSFPVPNYEEVFFKDEIKKNLSYEGVLSGIEDESGLPVSFSALLVKENLTIDLANPNNEMSSKLLTHFKKLSATYLATKNYFNHFTD